MDLSELEGRTFTCDEKCGLCCLCQAEVLPHELPFFKKNHPRPHRGEERAPPSYGPGAEER